MSNWIKVSERLPKVGEIVLVWRVDPSRADIVEYSARSKQHLEFIRRDKQWWDSGSRITHWQPLPAPPEE